jgi:superfamily II DNA or RNA helicase
MEELVTVQYFNEVYVKLDCDPSTAMEISDYFTFEVPGAKFSPAYRNKLWDGKIRIFNPMNKLLYAGLTHQLELFCKSRNYNLVYSDRLNVDAEFSLFEAKEFIQKLNLKYEVRDYQLDGFVHAIRKSRSLLLSPTGSGKSLLIYLLTCFYKSKTLIIVPTTSLVNQMSSDFVDYGMPKNLIHKIMSGQEKDSSAPIFVSTWQSIFKMPKTWFSQFDVVIGDEAHLYKAKSLTSILTKLETCKYRFGLTGTLDGTQTHKWILEGLFGQVKQVTSTSKLIEQKYLADFSIKALVLQYPDEIKKLYSKADFQSEMDFIVTNQQRNNFIKNLALSLNGNVLLLFQFVEKHGKILHDMLSKDIDPDRLFFISGAISAEKREEIRQTLEQKTNCVVVASYGTTSTGVNIKNLDNVIFASPSKSRIRNLQSIGRVLRRSETKISATLYDIADDFSYKKSMNHTLRHFIERVKIYTGEKFPYKIYNIKLE